MSYFYPSGRIMRALRSAVRRGVRVRLLFPQRSDVAIAKWAAQGLYGRLLRGGMEVWEYRLTMLHPSLPLPMTRSSPARRTLIYGAGGSTTSLWR